MLRRGLAFSLAIHGTIIAVVALAQARIPSSRAMTLDLTHLVLKISPGGPSSPGGNVALTGRPMPSGADKAGKSVGKPAPKRIAPSDSSKDTFSARTLSESMERNDESAEGRTDKPGDVVPEMTVAESPGPTASGGGTGDGNGAGGVYAPASLDTPLVAISRKPPSYPLRARRAAIEGRVEIELLVNDRGGVDEVRIVGAQPPGVFEESVKQTVPGWRFKPGTFRGRPVRTLVATTIRFELRNNP